MGMLTTGCGTNVAALMVGGGPFDPGAVFFTPMVEFGIASAIGVTNSAKGTMFYWFKGTYGNGRNYNMNTADVMSNLMASQPVNSESVAGWDNVFDNASGFTGTFRTNMGGLLGGASNNDEVNTLGRSALVNGVWQAYLQSWDLSVTPKRAATYLWMAATGWVKVSAGVGDNMTTTPVVNFNNSYGFTINPILNQGYRGTFGFSQFFTDLQNSIVDSSLNISSTDLAKFVGTGPVDLLSDGSGPFGRQPEIYRYGNKTGFLTNRGTHSSTWAAIGTAAALYDAPYSPLGLPTGKAVVEWVSSISSSRATGVNTVSIDNNCNPIAVGDLLVAVCLPSNGAPAAANTFANQNGWTVAGQVNWGVSGEGGNVCVLWKIADSGDVTAAGTLKTYIFTCLNNVTWGNGGFMCSIKGHDPTTPIDVTPTFQANATGAGLIAPDITPSTSNCTLLSLFTQDGNQNNANIRAPATGNEIFSTGSPAGNGPGLLASFEYLTGSSAPGTRTATTTTAGKVANCGATVLIRHA